MIVSCTSNGKNNTIPNRILVNKKQLMKVRRYFYYLHICPSFMNLIKSQVKQQQIPANKSLFTCLQQGQGFQSIFSDLQIISFSMKHLSLFLHIVLLVMHCFSIKYL